MTFFAVSYEVNFRPNSSNLVRVKLYFNVCNDSPRYQKKSLLLRFFEIFSHKSTVSYQRFDSAIYKKLIDNSNYMKGNFKKLQ